MLRFDRPELLLEIVFINQTQIFRSFYRENDKMEIFLHQKQENSLLTLKTSDLLDF